MPSAPLNLKGVEYPLYSRMIGYFFTLTPLLAIPGCALYQLRQHDYNWVI